MATDQSRLLELSAIIADGTRKIDSYLREKGLPSPSLSVDAPPQASLPLELFKAQSEVLQASSELQVLINGPLTHLTRLASPTNNVFMSLQAIYRYRIALALSFDEEVSYAELAIRCRIDPSDLKRLLRLAVAFYIFEEPRKGYIRHNATSKLLVQSPLLHQWIGVLVDEMWAAGARTVDSMQKWPGSEEPTETGYALAHGQSLWDALRSNELRAQRFADGMQYLQSHPIFDISHLFRDLGWTEETCPKLLVDVGGSHGSVAIKLLRRFPRLRCIIEDMPEVVTTARVPEDVADRIEFQPYNFFMPQPVKGADVYFFRSILHDWSDKYAVQIIRNLVPAMKPGARIIFNEVCLPQADDLEPYHIQVILGYDLAMKHSFNSKERDVEDWGKLLAMADPRFEITRIAHTPGSILSVIEVAWTGPDVTDDDETLSTDGSSVEEEEEDKSVTI
ncbi:putative O-methyltransferase [Pseudovirgaria hyperparasitica]|uniref:Putative O-methyltransferase n=1 Tax=Pseudovirgaria hyperparasitica TaxID=470096 RepID=A0A6A6W550_9PEZI|nr:putative O-methyltransferase [Pseudovirgaria hyperparasitica]KAF2757675.1 putative O-methyltransferase [Pseudovirgaria hyperparasitica]